MAPYVAPDEAENRESLDVIATARQMGAGAWRLPLVASPALRVVLLQLPQGGETSDHTHAEDEFFYVVGGSGSFRIGDELLRACGPGSLLFARGGVRHQLLAGDEAFVFLAGVAPNEDVPEDPIQVDPPPLMATEGRRIDEDR